MNDLRSFVGKLWERYGDAMSGLLLAGRRGAGGESTFLLFLMD